MAGVLNKSKTSREKLLFRQMDDGKWEAWALDEAGVPRLHDVCALPSEITIPPQSVIALPARQVFAVPLWLATTDQSLMRDMIFLQLERRGIAGGRSAAEVVFDYLVVSATENKTLVLAVALPGTLPEYLCLAYERFEPSPLLYPLAADEFSFWREDGRLVVAVTHGGSLVYFQSLGDGVFTSDVLLEVECIRLQLEAIGALAALKGVTLWGEFDSGEILRLSETLGLPARDARLPAPLLPGRVMNLVPVSVRNARQLAKKEERRSMLVTAVACLYFLFVLVMVLRTSWYYIQCRRIESELAGNRALVEDIKATAKQWDLVSPAIEPESYPVEQLLRCARLLPPEGVRFTLFKTTGDRIFIQGEAKSPTAAFKFAEDLKQSKDLASYQWQMPQPRVLVNNNAEFQIEGVRYGAKAE